MPALSGAPLETIPRERRATRAGALHVAQIGFFIDPRERAPERLLADWPTLVDVAECAHGAGVRTSVIQSSGHTRSLEHGGVAYHFLPFGGRSAPIVPGCSLDALIARLAPDVFHVHGLGFSREVLALAALAPATPILLQDHADRVPRPWRRRRWRQCASAISGVAFCSCEQAQPFARAGLLGDRVEVHEVPEATSRFTPGSREEARRALHVAGEPLVLWVGHLDENKDPLTVLEGVGRAAGALPALALYCCFGTAPLLRKVERRIATDARLRGRVQLLGPVPHGRIELLMRAADLFVLGSHREGSGYSLIEALACGLPPIVSDIPSFRALTGRGSVGKLWPCGDADALARAVVTMAAQSEPAMRAAVRAHFDRELSFAALGRKLAAVYELTASAGQRTAGGERSDVRCV